MNHSPELSSARWRRSSYSNTDGGECVEISDDFPGIIPVRDSKNPTGPALVVQAAAWNGFVASLK
ncbi:MULTISPECIES: DUF397 domain-containing protein [unclassified Streptomyces]|uniref:DUF397 domain-containing protein n=1 Tax=unclassified Streptomyces TaxID=2593676 RepID=UPI000368FE67|nr:MULTISPECIES: DUF397 domain-containing protein [unclassified Streptomyces]MYY02265.1 DUF397 domain-containing protein [Streptomyces sp. SID4913]